jgi:hypothetical protein
MKRSSIYLNITLLGSILLAGMIGCNRPGILLYRSLSESDKVAELVQIRGHWMTVIDFALLRDTIILPLSYLTEELHIVKLDNRDEALVSERGITIGNQYILVSSALTGRVPFRLFNKSGEFITNIGGFGQGPGEYSSSVSAWQLDETNNRIYLLPGFRDGIFVYDFSGTFLDIIPLPFRLTNVYSFYVDMENKLVSFFAPPINDDRFIATYCAWVQKISGEVIHGISSDFVEMDPNHDFPNNILISSNNNANALDVHFYPVMTPRNDTLYHYDVKRNELIPRFTINYGRRTIPNHIYTELPHHYFGYFYELVIRNWHIHSNPKHFIVEKESLRGAYFRLVNDFLGNIEIEWPVWSFESGYFGANYEPGTLLDMLENALENNIMTDKMREKIIELIDSIDENGNNIILYAKLKQ